LQKQRKVDVERTEPHAIAAELCASGLVERPQLVSDGLPLEDAEALREPEGDATSEAGQILRLAELDELLEALADRLVEPARQPLLDLLLVRRLQMLVDQEDELRLQRVLAGL